MSSSAVSTANNYKLVFTPVTTAQELIVDFCSNSPLVGDTCSFAGTSVPTVASPVSDLGTASAVGSGSPVHTIKVVGLTMTGGSAFTINFTSGVTNPSTAGTFYARVLTFPTAGAAGYTPANTTGSTPTTGSPTDTGGIALSTANNIQINAKVFETLSFCVFQTSCGTAPVLTLGDPTTGALSSSSAYINTAGQYTLGTNAGGGAVVKLRGQTLCKATPLSFANCPTGASGSTITAIGSTATAVNAGHIGTEQFGMCVNGITSLTAQSPYNDGSCPTTATTSGTYAGAVTFGFDDTNSGTGTNGTAGATILSSSGAVSTNTGNFSFAANISSLTEAGLYQSNLNLVATGTF